MMTGFAGSRNALDLVDDISAFDHFTEYSVTPALNGLGAVVQEGVVSPVDEELRRGRMRLHGAGHGDAVLLVRQTVVGFVLDAWALVFLFFHARLETAALNHEVTDYTVENRVFVVASVNVFDEVGYGQWRLFCVQLQNDVAVVGGQLYFGHVESRSIVMHEWAHYDPDAQFTDEVTFFSAFAAFMPSNVHSVVRDLTASAMISALI
ncbi:hypothetical protein ALO37_102785 [Pseudomonas savastanoi pv. glycinea]|nr:hypothetical protein ALO37_102785 [Pseudomonas savastanoi pv. glycinea]RMP86007.1 hypothetical protein ALQ14_103096 [Pseudomonas savastanoi pv. glycinea]